MYLAILIWYSLKRAESGIGLVLLRGVAITWQEQGGCIYLLLEKLGTYYTTSLG
jgi:hypothetical protein